MTTKDLQFRLNEIADRKLNEKLDSVFKPIIDIGIRTLPTPYSRGNRSASAFDEVLFTLRKLAFDALQDGYRDLQSHEFIAKVHRCAESVDEIRSYTQQD